MLSAAGAAAPPPRVPSHPRCGGGQSPVGPSPGVVDTGDRPAATPEQATTGDSLAPGAAPGVVGKRQPPAADPGATGASGALAESAGSNLVSPGCSPRPRGCWRAGTIPLRFPCAGSPRSPGTIGPEPTSRGATGGRNYGHQHAEDRRQPLGAAMVTRVTPVRARAVVGDTVMVQGRPAVVVDLLPPEPGRARAARGTHDPPCRTCETQPAVRGAAAPMAMPRLPYRLRADLPWPRCPAGGGVRRRAARPALGAA